MMNIDMQNNKGCELCGDGSSPLKFPAFALLFK